MSQNKNKDKDRDKDKPKEQPPFPQQDPFAQTLYTPGVSLGEGYGIPEGRYSEPEFGLLSAGILTRLRGDIDKEIEQIRGLTATNVADITGRYSVQTAQIGADATKYVGRLDLEAKKYLADQDFAKAVRVTELQTKNNLDLQNIINAGMKEVEGIRGQTAKDVASITGEYAVKQEATRQEGQKDIARIGSDVGFRNALISAFSF